MSSEEKLASSPETPPIVALMRLVQGYRVSEAIFVAVKLGVPDQIAKGLKSYTELANSTGTHAPSLYRLLRYLSTLGILVESGEGKFELTPIGEPLRHGVPGSLSHVRLFMEPLSRESWAWNNLLSSLKTGETAFNQVHGMGLFQYLAQHPESAAVFNDAMSEGSAISSTEVVSAYDFSNLNTIVDVGGGHGRLLVEILRANPNSRGVLFDLPEVAGGAKKQIEVAGLTARCIVHEGDFFTEVPSGGDAYILRQIIHDWDDTACVKILKNVRRAVQPKGKLLLLEVVLPERMKESLLDQVAASNDINMMVITGGRERTASEFRRIFETAGFELTRIIPTRGRECIIEAKPKGYGKIKGSGLSNRISLKTVKSHATFQSTSG